MPSRITREALAVWSIPVLLLCAALAFTGCATPAPATTFIVADAVDEGADQNSQKIANISENKAVEAPAQVALDCPCLNCTCDPCTCQAVAKAETPRDAAPQFRRWQVGPKWFGTYGDGRNYEYRNVRVRKTFIEQRPACGGDQCEMQDVQVTRYVTEAKWQEADLAASTKEENTSPGRTIRRGRGFFGRQ